MENTVKWLNIMAKLSKSYADTLMEQYGLNSSHYPYLLNIYQRPGIKRDKLPMLVYTHPSNISRALDFLEKNGFIVKEILECDKRTCRLYPTEKTAFIYNRIDEQWLSLITEDFSEIDKNKFIELIERAGETAMKKVIAEKNEIY